MQNVMTLSHILHELFDKLAPWFEETVGRVPNTPGRTTTRILKIYTECAQACIDSTRWHAFPSTCSSEPNGRTFLYHRQDIWGYMRLVAVLRICLVRQNITAIWTTTIHL